MATPIDLELKKAFAELQAKMIDTQQKAKMADLQIEQLSRVKKHANLTNAEIATLPNTTRMYEGIGPHVHPPV
uniref:Prefoldin subunit 1 n=1 Tax=Anguilla anguilla TaxID=7936 RepID=A0A0E9TEA1_ANGAN